MASDKINDGGHAFPSPGVVMPSGHQQGAYAGMSLRDYFAGQAFLAGISDGEGVVSGWESNYASRCYELADAMIAERERSSDRA